MDLISTSVTCHPIGRRANHIILELGLELSLANSVGQGAKTSRILENVPKMMELRRSFRF
jgi:hypothetical protein